MPVYCTHSRVFTICEQLRTHWHCTQIPHIISAEIISFCGNYFRPTPAVWSDLTGGRPLYGLYWERLGNRRDGEYDTGIECSIIVDGHLSQCELMMGDFSLTCIPLDMQV